MNDTPVQLDRLWRGIDRFTAALPSDEEEPESARLPSRNREFPERSPEKWSDDEEEQLTAEEYIYDRIIFNLSRRLQRYSEQRNVFKVKTILEDMATHLPYASHPDSSSLQERIDGLLEEIQLIEPVLLFSVYGEDEEEGENVQKVITSPQIVLPKLVVEVRRELASRIARDPELLRRISPREFEELMAEVFSTFGYVVELTAPSRDGGKDIVAVRMDHGIVSKLLIECKRYVPPNKVDVGLIRQLYAVKQIEHASKALLVTTSYFTRGARELEKQYLYELELKDFDAVVGWVKEYAQFLTGGARM